MLSNSAIARARWPAQEGEANFLTSAVIHLSRAIWGTVPLGTRRRSTKCFGADVFATIALSLSLSELAPRRDGVGTLRIGFTPNIGAGVIESVSPDDIFARPSVRDLRPRFLGGAPPTDLLHRSLLEATPPAHTPQGPPHPARRRRDRRGHPLRHGVKGRLRQGLLREAAGEAVQTLAPPLPHPLAPPGRRRRPNLEIRALNGRRPRWLNGGGGVVENGGGVVGTRASDESRSKCSTPMPRGALAPNRGPSTTGGEEGARVFRLLWQNRGSSAPCTLAL